MQAPRLEIDLDKIYHNAHTLVKSMGLLGISVTGITKAAVGLSQIADTILQAGAVSTGDSRIENIIAMRHAGLSAPMVLIRTPALSQIEAVIANVDTSFNTELEVIRQLSASATKTKRKHAIVLMIELGDLREGIMLDDVAETVRQTLSLPYISLQGIGANLACQNGVIPDEKNMDTLSNLAVSIESSFGIALDTVSGGNSSNLLWAMSGSHLGRINNLRLGESILLGRHPTNNEPIAGLFTDAFTFIAEVIESKAKPSQPWGSVGHATFEGNLSSKGPALVSQVIFAAGHQDIDPAGLTPIADIKILGASSDHLIVDARAENLPIGSESKFRPNYRALLRAMTSAYVLKVFSPRKLENS